MCFLLLVPLSSYLMTEEYAIHDKGNFVVNSYFVFFTEKESQSRRRCSWQIMYQGQ